MTERHALTAESEPHARPATAGCQVDGDPRSRWGVLATRVGPMPQAPTPEAVTTQPPGVTVVEE